MLNHSYLGENNNIIWGVRSKDLHSSVFMKIMTLKYKNLKVLMRVGEIFFAVIVFPQTTKGIECNSQPQFYVQPRFVFRIIYRKWRRPRRKKNTNSMQWN